MAGTNDIFHPRYRLEDALFDYREMLDAAEGAADRCIVTLPPKTRNASTAKTIAELNANITPLIRKSKCHIIDLNPIFAPDGILLEQYTTDGVHMSSKAYEEWANQLNKLSTVETAHQ
jgi:lysophospholipase L1-like esterase